VEHLCHFGVETIEIYQPLALHVDQEFPADFFRQIGPSFPEILEL